MFKDIINIGCLVQQPRKQLQYLESDCPNTQNQRGINQNKMEKDTFPISKIKAQLLRDHDVGRVSTKAVELIAACSALFVNDLTRFSTEVLHTRNKKKSTSKTSTTSNNNDVTVVTLAHIKKSVKSKKEYLFLDGVLDRVSEKSAFQYDAAAAKKRKRMEESNNINENTKQKSKTSKKTKSVPKLPSEVGGSDDNNVENRALREAVETAASLKNDERGNGAIIEDEDDYD